MYPTKMVSSEVPESMARRALEVIASYGVHAARGAGNWEAFDTLLPVVTQQVAAAVPIQLLLPGFPFKDPSRDLVLGALPDLGEELALAHLQKLCDSVAAVYKHGAEIVICSDGLVYNDLMGVSEETVWEYGEAVRLIATSKGLRSIRFIRLWHVLGDETGRQLYENDKKKAKANYLEQAGRIREELVTRCGDAQAGRAEGNAATTYNTYVDILSKRAVDSPEAAAEAMLSRGKAYGAALQAKYPEHVRLSIHDSAGKDKLSLALIPSPRDKGSVGLMPWRSVVAVDADGSHRAVYPDQALRDTHELVYKGGRPYCYRAKSGE